jgi:hypothetical protein
VIDPQHCPDDAPARYQIRVRGALDPRWSSWFAELTISQDQGDTVLAGWLADQAALYGAISRMRDLGLTLLAVARLPPTDSQD